jgi:hypothetical protein
MAQQVQQVPPAAAARIDYPHAGRNPSAQQLVEEIDVDLAELLLEVGLAAIVWRTTAPETVSAPIDR